MAESVQRLQYGALVALFAAGLAWGAAGPAARASASPGPSRKTSKLRSGSATVPSSLRRAIDRTLPQDWSQQAELTAGDGEQGDEFGVSVALSADGHTALVGAPNAFYVSGAAYVFTKTAGSWTETAEICCGFGGDAFGSSVALSADGTTALISAPGYSIPQIEIGAVFVYTGSNWGGWTARLEAGDQNIFDRFGESVALSADGSTALIGADGHNSDAGAAYVFTGSGSNWSQQAELTASDGAGGDKFGSVLALSPDGTTALVGSPNRNSNTGAAYVFDGSGGTWSQNTELTASDGAAGDYFGQSTALSSDGTTALVGAAGHDSGNGAAYVYTESGGSWSQQAELTASDGAADDFFGAAAALSGDAATTLVGAYGRNSFTGAAYIFTQPVAQASFRPASGPAGTTTHLLGTGFTPGETVNLSIHGRSNTVQANANGRFEIALRVPNVPPHAYTLTATGETSGLTAHAMFTVTASGPGIPVRPVELDHRGSLARLPDRRTSAMGYSYRPADSGQIWPGSKATHLRHL